MNLGLKDTGGELLLVSQFTLAASTTKGLRPGFASAKPPQQAEQLLTSWSQSTSGSWCGTKRRLRR